jgi:hypothetical protein
MIIEMLFNNKIQIWNAWMMFDHKKHVQRWTTVACHVYDTIYCKVMLIMVCDMQSKDIETQCMVWKRLNAVVEKKGMGTPMFKGFMHYEKI